jgi:hypothetical protein
MSDTSGPSPVSSQPSSPVTGTGKSAGDSPSGTPATFDTSTKIGSFNELPPELRRMMELGIAQNICVRIQHQTRNLKKAMREGREQANS